MLSSDKEIVQQLLKNAAQMEQDLHQFCAINSGTTHVEGLEQMKQLLQSAFQTVADEIHVKPLPPVQMLTLTADTCLQYCGDALFIRKRPELTRRVLLSGHMDTVYPANSTFQQLTYLSDNHLRGPGVADMKGGLVVMLHALQAFEQTKEKEEMGWDILINADEEIGSPASKTLFNQFKGQYQAALVYEPTMTPSGTLAKNRKGSGKFTVVALGKSAHAGRAFDEGRNAICYLAEAVTAIHHLNGQRPGVTINVGKILGGEALNVVPDTAVAQLDIRISDVTDQDWINHVFAQIITKLQRDDYSLTIQGEFGRPVKRVNKATERLFTRIQQVGHTLGLNIDWKDSGGCCDGNNFAHQGLTVIDTLGVRGGNIHSHEEYILLDSLAERAALSALVLADLARGGLEDLKA